MDSQPLYDLIGRYGLYAVFFLAMIEGDITLLLAGVLAHSGFFGDYSYLKALAAGTAGGVVSDHIAYFSGRGFRQSIRSRKFYSAAQPRLYGLRTASCVFYGVGRMPFLRFLPLTILSCALWVGILVSAGYFFSGAITNFIGDFHQIGFFLLIIVVLGITAFYLVERMYISRRVEEDSPKLIHEFEQAAHERISEFSQEFQERLHKKRQNQLPRNKRAARRTKRSAGHE
jgi:membrane protein DedA with SNARE-associated domain